MKTMIELELLREKLFNVIRGKIIGLNLIDANGRRINHKECSNLLLRYLFNKICEKGNRDEPIFITHRSLLAENQLYEDFKYHKIERVKPELFIALVESEFKKGLDTIQSTTFEADEEIVLDEQSKTIVYKKKSYQDIGELGKKFPDKLPFALALNIRYTYLQLLTHGLANDYAALGYKPSDLITEGFASVYNHYFDRFHSAFPDLEEVYGSRGSFFECKEFETDVVMVNPPFDLSVMKECIKRCLMSLESDSTHSFYITLPAWMDVVEFTGLQKTKYTRSYEIIPKDKTRFLDHMRGLIIQPCNIIQVHLSNSS